MSLPDQKHEHLVISLNSAIRQGRTSYPFLILTIASDHETENFKLNLSEYVVDRSLCLGSLSPLYSFLRLR